jgi:superfamily II DNA or RNA helicase
MLSLPTGAGKTRVAVEALVEEVLRASKPRRVLWIAQQDELCEQAVVTFAQHWRYRGTEETLTISRVWQGNRPESAAGPQVVVATVASLLNRMREEENAWLREPEVAVIDEARHGADVHPGPRAAWERLAHPHHERDRTVGNPVPWVQR